MSWLLILRLGIPIGVVPDCTPVGVIPASEPAAKLAPVIIILKGAYLYQGISHP